MPKKTPKFKTTDYGFGEPQFPKTKFAPKAKVEKMKEKPSASKYK